MAKTLFQTPKGIRDVLPEEQSPWYLVEASIRRIVNIYGYGRLDLPVFEDTALYERGVGEGTDIVEKEMYTFRDRGGNSMTLRPEFTAGVVRAYLQHGMANLTKPVRVWNLGPVFRYERPQAGRFRQHMQFNVEALGEQDPALDVEVMSVAWQLYESLEFRDLNFQVNSIGCPACRPAYLESLIDYYRNHEKTICEDCLKRMSKNPLRLLDCKQPQCQPVIDKAPPISARLCAECKDHFKSLRDYLDDLGRPYTLNHRLVRGLDYYTKTVFEVWAEGIGAQNAICGGGRYDGLAEVLGGPFTPAVGFASGLERIVLTMQQENKESVASDPLHVYLAVQGVEAKQWGMGLLSDLRSAGIPSILGFGDRSLKAQMREANRREVLFCILMGEEELKTGNVIVKRMDGGDQEKIPKDEIVDYFLKQRDGK